MPIHLHPTGEMSSRTVGAALGRTGESQPVRTERGDYTEFYRLLVAALDSGGAPPVDPKDAVVTLEIVEAAHRSHARGQVMCMQSV